MFLNKFRLLANFCQKHRVINETIQRNKVMLPNISFVAREFSSRFWDDDDDDNFVPRNRNNNSKSKTFYPRESRTDYRRSQSSYNDSYQPRVVNNFYSQPSTVARPEWDKIELNAFQKNFYQPHETTVNRSEEEVQQFRKTNQMTLSNGAPKPIFSFDELNLPPNLKREIEKADFQTVTPIQAQGFPIALSGNNMVGIAQTGSGKTLAFLIPAIIHILNQPKLNRGEGPIAAVIAPTRELAQQIQKVATQFGNSSGIRNVCLFGGAAKEAQFSFLNRGCELVIGTPGRMNDFISTGGLNMRRCTFLVLDEADRMLDMGFEPQIRTIIDQIRPDRQTMMWSATWPREVKSLAQDYLKEYIQLNVGSMDLSANPNVKQVVTICTRETKNECLREIISEILKLDRSERKTIVFTETKRTADYVANEIGRLNIRSEAIHGDKSQRQRDSILNSFRNGHIDVLVATDVASRGLDVDNIKHVINYDYPKDSTDYVHRIGRTGRSNNTGTAYTLFTNDNASQAPGLVAIMKQAKQEIDNDLLQIAKKPYQFGAGNSSGNQQRSRYNYSSNRRW